MKKMDLGQTLSIIANIGVVAGIAFLVIELQQNTRSLEMNGYQELIGQINTYATLLLERPELSEAARSAPAELSKELAQQVSSMYYLITRQGDLAFYQYQRGILTEERLESTLGPLLDRICYPSYRDFWEGANHNFVADYRHYIDSRLDKC